MARRLRVVAGTAGGLHLVAPKHARPTTDRTKEALFASLGPERLGDAVVLDLYSGSGALGIEALSRGAARAVFVDRDRSARQAIRANLVTTGFSDRSRVHGSPVVAFLKERAPEAPFSLVLVDPPYDLATAESEAILAALATPGWLAPGAAIVVESRVGRRPGLPHGWRVERERAYGDTLLVVATA